LHLPRLGGIPAAGACGSTGTRNNLDMKAGIAALIAGYLLSQFYRAFLAVLSPVLVADLGVTAADLGRASGMFLLGFALLQLPIGLGLDRIGPRRITAGLLGLGAGGGAAVFALAQGPWAIAVAMTLIGAGCAPVLMAAYYIFARMFPPQLFATLGATVVAVGSLGNLGSTVPLALAVARWGWRPLLWAMAAISLAVALIVALLVRDPPRLSRDGGSFRALLGIRALWPMLPILSLNYIAIGLSGLWIGPFLADRYGLGPQGIGWVALTLGAAMIAGTLAYGPMDRLTGSRKWVAFAGNMTCAAMLLALAAWTTAPLGAAVALLTLTLFSGATYPVVMAHARAYAPPEATGRAVGLLNFFSIGGAGLMQVTSARVHGLWPDWSALFLFFGLPLLAAALIYSLSRDNMA
jgi:MFS family permease